MIAIRVAADVSALTAGLLRATLYPEDEVARCAVERSFGRAMVERGRALLGCTYYRDKDAALLLADCTVPTTGALLICPCDQPHDGATLYRSRGQDGPGEVLAAFPHGWWPPNDPAWSGSAPPRALRIGFCGIPRPELRHKAIERLIRWRDSSPAPVVDLILRKEFMGRELPQRQARVEYLAHMDRNLYQLCARGVGDYCYRLYETLSWGRVPIVVGPRALPWSHEINWSRQAVLVPRVDELAARVASWHACHEDETAVICEENRRLWLDYLSPAGWWTQAAHFLGAT